MVVQLGKKLVVTMVDRMAGKKAGSMADWLDNHLVVLRVEQRVDGKVVMLADMLAALWAEMMADEKVAMLVGR
jgi:hypothetical protein